MTAAEQHRLWGAAVEASNDGVVIQVGKEMVWLAPADAQHFAYYLARAYSKAGGAIRSRGGTWMLERPGTRTAK